MAGRPISEKSKEIIKLVKSGKSFSYLRDLGYPIETVKYYIRKLRYPNAYDSFIKKVIKLNRKRHKLDNKK